ncbi:MAG: hypothetical protein JNK54_05350 [Elusimicrobia bacterium]|jgi:hypothetical protein|nr:hypothetical protein [Elusimicrobiota bacterium]
MIWVGVALGLLFFVFLARLFSGAFRAADHPTFVMEKPAWPRKLAPVAEALDRWREEGRLTREEHERMMSFLREESAPVLRP